MDIRSPPAPIYVFGPFRLDAGRMTLTRDGVAVDTTPRVASTLLYLIEHAGELVSREEMLRVLWPGRVAEEANLSQAVSAVRKALATDGDTTEWILTVPGKGYRFTGQVEREPQPPPSSRPPPIPPPEAAAPAEAPRPRRLSRRAMGSGAGLALGAALAGGWLLTHRSQPPREDHTNVVLAAPLNETGEPVFDHVVPRVLQIDLAQSPFLQVAGDAKVAQTLELMKKPLDTPLTDAVAREVCVRNNGGALVTPAVTRLGSSYVLAVSAVDCMGGRTLYEGKATAADKDAVARTLDLLSNRLRARLGEAQASITRFDVPLMAEKTGSFDALAAYSEGVQLHAHGREAEAIAAFQHAVDLDPSFAMAYDGLYNPLYVTKQAERAQAAIAKAYALRDTVSDRDRLLISSHYHFFVQNDLYAALDDLRLFTGLYPREMKAWTNLSNVENWLGDYPSAVAAGERALSLDPNNIASYSVLARALDHDGQIARAVEVDEAAVQRGVAGGDTRGQLIGHTFALGQRRRAEKLIDEAHGTPLERDALLEAFDVYVEGGKMRRADAAVVRALELGRSAGISDDHVAHAQAYLDLGLRDRARAELAQVSPADRDGPYYVLEAWMNEPAGAQADLARALAKTPHDTLLHDYYAPEARAVLLWRRGDARAAVQALQVSSPLIFHDIDAPYVRGLLQLDAGDPAGAAQSFRAVLARTGFGYSTPYDLARLGLARALRRTGDLAGSRQAYAGFFAAWRDADADLPVLKAARAEYAELKSTPPNPRKD